MGEMTDEDIDFLAFPKILSYNVIENQEIII